MRLALKTLGVAFLCGFLTWTVTISITPLRQWTQELGSCRGADRIERDVRDGGDVRGRGGGGSSTTSTTVFELRCTYDGGERVELVGNDEGFLRGALVGFLLGAVPGAVLYLGRRGWRGRSANSGERAAVTGGQAS